MLFAFFYELRMLEDSVSYIALTLAWSRKGVGFDFSHWSGMV